MWKPQHAGTQRHGHRFHDYSCAAGSHSKIWGDGNIHGYDHPRQQWFPEPGDAFRVRIAKRRNRDVHSTSGNAGEQSRHEHYEDRHTVSAGMVASSAAQAAMATTVAFALRGRGCHGVGWAGMG